MLICVCSIVRTGSLVQMDLMLLSLSVKKSFEFSLSYFFLLFFRDDVVSTNTSNDSDKTLIDVSSI